MQAGLPHMDHVQRIGQCRSCGNPDLETILDLGRVPLANALLTAEGRAGPEAAFPLTLAFCSRCSLVQILETVDPEVLFGEYLYLSSFSQTMLAHAREEAETLMSTRHLGPDSLVMEVASNDGYLLKNFVAAGVPVLGIEPARNIADVAEKAGVRTMCAFFGRALGERLRSDGRLADVVIGNNVLAHVADLNGFVEGVKRVLKDSGVAAFEFPYVGDMIDRTEFDTIYHEHLCYYSLHSIERLFASHGLGVTHVERHTIHGGSLRIYCEHGAAGKGPGPSGAVKGLRDEERERGMTHAGFYRSFARKVEDLKRNLLAELGRWKARGSRIAAYGASAKGSTLMNYVGIGSETIDFVVDRSTVKQNKYTPGNHLPIRPPEALLEEQPDAVLLLTWNFADEIFRQQAEYLRRGGRFVVPVPEVRVVAREVLG